MGRCGYNGGCAPCGPILPCGGNYFNNGFGNNNYGNGYGNDYAQTGYGVSNNNVECNSNEVFYAKQNCFRNNNSACCGNSEAGSCGGWNGGCNNYGNSNGGAYGGYGGDCGIGCGPGPVVGPAFGGCGPNKYPKRYNQPNRGNIYGNQQNY